MLGLSDKLAWLIISITFVTINSTHAKWWQLSQYNLQYDSLHVVCDHIPGLDKTQRHYCRKYPSVMIAIAEGLRLAIEECQHQFQYQRWNCSTNPKDPRLFGKPVLSSLSRETAFIYSITSAGVVHSITRSCSRGSIDNCACDLNRGSGSRGRDTLGMFSWGGCSQNIRYAALFARMFIDSTDRHVKDANALMNLHNNRVGRKVVSKSTRLICKCHGVSGSCLVRTCWRVTNDFRVIGSYLMKKYSEAKHVDLHQTGNRIRQIRDLKWKSPKTDHLIYLDSSPDYCFIDRKNGLYGTEGRECNKTSSGADSCDIMCCGMGYQTRRVTLTYSCDCRFFWCCRVRCRVCEVTRLVYTCRK